MNTRFPSDLLIFSPSYATIAECSQWRTNGLPVSASLCATSHSWCGKIRSVPPPCRSSVGPSSCIDIAEHSMCHPGRPTPNGRAPRGLVGQRRLPEHEVQRVAPVRVLRVAAARPCEAHHLLVSSTATAGRSSGTSTRRSTRCRRSGRRGRSRAAARRSTRSRRSSRSRAGSAIGGRMPSASMSDRKRVSSDSASSRYGMPSSRAFGRMESSTSVTLRTIRTSWPELLEPACEDVVGEVRRRHGRGASSRTGVMPHTYIRTTVSGENGTILPTRGVVQPDQRASDPAEPEPGSDLVADVDRQQHRGERLHADGVLQRPAVERAQVRDALDDRPSAWREHCRRRRTRRRRSPSCGRARRTRRQGRDGTRSRSASATAGPASPWPASRAAGAPR